MKGERLVLAFAMVFPSAMAYVYFVALSPVVVAVPPHSYVNRHHWQAREQLLRARGLGHDPVIVIRLAPSVDPRALAL